MGGELARKQGTQVLKLTERLAAEYGCESTELVKTLKTNVIHISPGDSPVTNAELFHVLTVMNRYKLDPWMKQVHAWRAKGKLHVMVGFDGWVSQANRHPGFKGVEYEYPAVSEMVVKSGKKCWPWIKATCHIEGRAPTVVYAFLDEWYIASKAPWTQYPSHRLRMKAYTMAVREALGIALYDEADYEQLSRPESAYVASATEMRLDSLKEKIGAEIAPDESVPEDAEPEPEPEPEQDTVDALFDELKDEGTPE